MFFVRSIGMIVLAVLVLFVLAGLLMWLWNITVPQVFGLKQITYWQAFRLLIIAAILFGGGSINFH
ncbi:succinate dehydrogenase hydrophobic anchor subunit [Desulfohalotomaculum tongense]|uniref:hypothetical protein n=1 Tax=Desulforadius tongensis TaxID=1216062 RepID=UPI0019593B2F|nr:hypothetical protein [Desulforadius tongensis]MBM7855797.1 succinate dehydrogenase hydrophobic anchor subunit [Desulforadius tongensis]